MGMEGRRQRDDNSIRLHPIEHVGLRVEGYTIGRQCACAVQGFILNVCDGHQFNARKTPEQRDVDLKRKAATAGQREFDWLNGHSNDWMLGVAIKSSA